MKMNLIFTQTCHRTLPTLIGTWETGAIEGHREKHEVLGYGGSFWALGMGEAHSWAVNAGGGWSVYLRRVLSFSGIKFIWLQRII